MGWSQEELAIASGLSTRTVQRLESDGKGSTSSVKSIASALEVEMHNLEKKPRGHILGVRFGYGGIIVGVACAVAAIAMSALSGEITTYQIGVSSGALGLIAGLSCAFLGWASARF